MPSTEGSQFPGTGSELSKNCLTSAWMTSACEYLQVSPLSLFLSLSPLASLSRTLDRPKITILNLFGNVVDARRSSCLVRMEKRKKSGRERERGREQGLRDTRRDSKARSSIELLRAIRDRKGEAITSSLQRRIATAVVASLSRRSTRMRDGGNEARYSILFSYLPSPFYSSLSLSLFLFSRFVTRRIVPRFQLTAVNSSRGMINVEK